MAKSIILGPDGEPISITELTQELPQAQLTGIRQVWQPSIARGLTPERLAWVLQSSIDNIYPNDYLMLAEEMEEREGQYFSVLGTRRDASLAISVSVEPATDSARDVEIADAVREMFALEFVEDSRADLMDALGKGYAVSGIAWDTSAKQWMPKAIERMPQHWFQFDRIDRTTLRLRDDSNLVDGLALTPYRYIVHRPRLKTGITIRGGLARVIAFIWICKAYALKDWMAFAEVFGMPLRIGKYGPNANKTDVEILRRAVANIGTDAAAVIPESMKIEFEQPAQTAGAGQFFEMLCTYLDKQISKIVVGQTMTTDDGSSLGQAKVHDQVCGDIRDSDCRRLAQTYNRDLVKPFVDLNYGPQVKYPRAIIHYEEKDDVSAMTDAVSKLVPLGLKVGQKTLRSKLGIPEPDKEEELLTPAVSIASSNNDPTAQGGERASNAAQRMLDGSVPDVVDAQVNRAAVSGDAVLATFVITIRKLLTEATSLEDFRDRLIETYSHLDASKFADVMQAALAAAQLAGRYDILEQAGGGGA
jgi:phage gp29-like protein